MKILVAVTLYLHIYLFVKVLTVHYVESPRLFSWPVYRYLRKNVYETLQSLPNAK